MQRFASKGRPGVNAPLAIALAAAAALGLAAGAATPARAQGTPPAGGEARARAPQTPAGEPAAPTLAPAAPAPGERPRTEVFVDLGVQTARLRAEIANHIGAIETTDSGAHVGIGARRSIGARNDIGVRLEFDEMGSNTMLAVRPLDFRHNVSDRLAFTGFFGVARLGLGTPAYGWYLGGGVQIKDLAPKWSLGLDLRYGDRLARDNVLPTDPHGGSPDNFHSVYGLSLYLSRRF